MVEAGAQEVSEAEMVAGPRRGPRRHQADRRAPEGAARAASASPSARSRRRRSTRRSWREIEGALAEPLLEAMRTKGKLESYAQMKQVKDAYVASIPEDQAETKAAVPAVYDGLREKLLRSEILENGRRLDGRRFDEIRPITSEVGVLPRTHGSALFTRGETQALVTVTLGHLRGLADHRHRAGGRVPQALHAPLQLPAVLGRAR